MATLELANIDERLYETLLAQAAKDNCSVREEVETILRKHLEKPLQDAQKSNEAFLKMIGSWQDDRTTEEIVADIRASRRPGRRFRTDTGVFD